MKQYPRRRQSKKIFFLFILLFTFVSLQRGDATCSHTIVNSILKLAKQAPKVSAFAFFVINVDPSAQRAAAGYHPLKAAPVLHRYFSTQNIVYNKN